MELLGKAQTLVISAMSDGTQFLQWMEDISDSRVGKWTFMASPFPTAIIAACYVAMVSVGPKLMSNRKPFDLKFLLIPYNLGVSLLNLYIAVELTILQKRLKYNWECQPVNYSDDPLEMRVAAALWWYYFSKFLEMADTVFFILRKKDSQLTFLHVYHHSSMFVLWWIGMKYVAGGSSVFGAMFNSYVHVCMYFYYFLTALGPQFRRFAWWKKYLTIVQLFQFAAAKVMGIRALVVGCDFPKWMQYSLVLYMMSFLVLFSNFYRNTYLNRRRSAKVPLADGTRQGGRNGYKPQPKLKSSRKDD